MVKMLGTRVWIMFGIYCAITGLLHGAAVIAEEENPEEEGILVSLLSFIKLNS